MQFNKTYLLLFLLLFLVEAAIAYYLKDGFIRHTFGDYLVVIMLYLFLKSFIKIKLKIKNPIIEPIRITKGVLYIKPEEKPIKSSAIIAQPEQRPLIPSIILNAFIIPTSDDHKSEYIADFWKTREWLSRFTGSAGTAVVTMNHAGLWTDSRYFIQAETELKKPFVLHKLKTRGPEFIDWLKSELKSGSKIAFDPEVFSYSVAHLRSLLLQVLPD